MVGGDGSSIGGILFASPHGSRAFFVTISHRQPPCWFGGCLLGGSAPCQIGTGGLKFPQECRGGTERIFRKNLRRPNAKKRYQNAETCSFFGIYQSRHLVPSRCIESLGLCLSSAAEHRHGSFFGVHRFCATLCPGVHKAPGLNR